MATLTPQEWIEYYRFHPSEFEAFIKFTENIAAERDALKEALEWAWSNLAYEVPYPDPESEYGQCVVCHNRDFDHKPNCKALKREKEARALLAKLEAK